MKKIFALLFALALFAAPSCARSQAETIAPKGHVTIAIPTPEQAVLDATNAMAEKDFTFRCVYGFALLCPGIEQHTDSWRFVSQNGIKTIDDTHDSLQDEADAKFNHDAAAYAKKYNQTMLTFLKTRSD